VVRPWTETAAETAHLANDCFRDLDGLGPDDRIGDDRVVRWLEDRIRRSDPVTTTSLIVGFDDERDGRGW
jgi:hypothetical protein